MAKNLTVKAVEAVKPADRRQEIPDGGQTGLYLIVQAKRERDGKELPAVMSWALRYRYQGKPRKLTIGSHPAFGLADAREAARTALRAVAEGRDPAGEKLIARRTAEDDKFENVIDEFVRRYVDSETKDSHGRVTKRLRDSTARETKRIIEAELKPKWKGRIVQSITRLEVRGILKGISDRGSPIMSNRVLAVLSKAFGWMTEEDILAVSPVVGVKAIGVETSRDRNLTRDEIRLMWMASENISRPFGALFKLLLLTGARRDEPASATWSEFELGGDQPVWIIPAERVKNGKEHAVPLSPMAVAVVVDLPKIDNAKANFLLTTNGEAPISGFSKAKGKLDAEMLTLAKKEASERGEDPEAVTLNPWRIHDLRRTAATGMASLGQPIHVIEAVLNHLSGSIRGVAATYNRFAYLDEKRRALSSWASLVDEIVNGKDDGNVVMLREAKK